MRLLLISIGLGWILLGAVNTSCTQEAGPPKPSGPPSDHPVQFVMHRVGTFRSEACGVGDFNNDGTLDIVAGPYLYLGPDWKAQKIRTLEGNVDGPTELCLMAGRDKRGGGGWIRPGRAGAAPRSTGTVSGPAVESLVGPLATVLDHGRWGEWDATQHYGPSKLLVVDDEIVLYYCAGAFGHEPEGSRSDAAGKNVYRTAIGRATLRLDGMVSLAAGEAEAVITTKPLRFAGGSLVVNASCPAGRLTVELLDREGKGIEGFTGGVADGFSGDDVRHMVSWGGKSDVSSLAGRPVRIRFRLRKGELYSFRFK